MWLTRLKITLLTAAIITVAYWGYRFGVAPWIAPVDLGGDSISIAERAGSRATSINEHYARRLAGLGIPIWRTLTGTATFEGADAVWLDHQTVLLGRGLRTNDEGLRQVCAALGEIGVQAIPVDMPVGSMHLEPGLSGSPRRPVQM